MVQSASDCNPSLSPDVPYNSNKSSDIFIKSKITNVRAMVAKVTTTNTRCYLWTRCRIRPSSLTPCALRAYSAFHRIGWLRWWRSNDTMEPCIAQVGRLSDVSGFTEVSGRTGPAVYFVFQVCCVAVCSDGTWILTSSFCSIRTIETFRTVLRCHHPMARSS